MSSSVPCRGAFAPLALRCLVLCACESSISLGGVDGVGGSAEGVGGGADGAGGSGGMATADPLPRVDKVDILLAIDNSGSMADKQEVLGLAISDLVQALGNPPCLDAGGREVPSQPSSAVEPCPVGLRRKYAPVVDMHVGIISSSLGGHGASTCLPQEGPSNNDQGRLLARLDPSGVDVAPTYEGKGFLAWDPLARYDPPGDADPATFAVQLRDLVLGVGQNGCGFEAQLESWYRFLVDPAPYESISVIDNRAVPQGVDTVLLQQRADFLRPDSLLVVLMLSDENDCSIIDGGVNYLVAERRTPGGGPFQLWRPRSECETSPDDPCCRSCQQERGECPLDPSCLNPDGSIRTLSALEDAVNLRCFDQKRRFGFDFLYPIARYTQALTARTIADSGGNLVQNPLFSDLNPADGISPSRDPRLIILAGIVGVPWQDIARDPRDVSQGFKNAAELAQPLPSGGTTWDVILGDPSSHVPPRDPLMIESTEPRSGVNPITGDPIAPPGSRSNPINGSEWTIAAANDLQYACIFRLAAPRSCDGGIACDCEDPGNDNPLCSVDPTTGMNTLQVYAKAYPGPRQLSLLKSLGEQGVTASICARQTIDDTSADFAYRPAIRALIAQLGPRL